MVKRQSFGRLAHVLDLPNLVEIQTKAFADFLQIDALRQKRQDTGLQEVFKEVFPIESSDGNYKLMFMHYTLSQPKYNIDESLRLG